MLKTLELVDRLGDSVPLYRMQCNMEREAADTVYRAMSEKKT